MVSHKIKLVNSSKLVSSSTISLQPNTLWIIHHHNTLPISTLSMYIYSIHLELNQATHNHNSHSHKEAIIRVLTRAWDNNNREVDKQHQLDPSPSSKVVWFVSWWEQPYWFSFSDVPRAVSSDRSYWYMRLEWEPPSRKPKERKACVLGRAGKP